MDSIRQKRLQMAKQIRSKQRNEKLALNRDMLFEGNSNQSLLHLIFLMIDKNSDKGSQITQQFFQQFLQMVALQTSDQDQEGKAISQKISSSILQRYGPILQQFQHQIQKCEIINRVKVMRRDHKMFDLIRFLFRVRIIKQNHLKILNDLLESIQMKVKQWLQTWNNFNVQKNPIINQFISLNELKIKLSKQLIYLDLLVKESNQRSQQKEHQNKYKNIKQIVIKLSHKWIINTNLIEEIFNVNLLNFINQQTLIKNKFIKLIYQFGSIYLQYVLLQNQVIQKIIDNKSAERSTQKLLEFIIILLLQLNYYNYQQDIDISSQISNNNQQQLISFLNLSTQIIKSIQNKISNHQHNSSLLLSSLLNLFIQLYIQKPTQAVNQFIDKINTIDNDKKNIYKNSVTFFIHQTTKSQQLLLVKLVHSIQDLQYQSLVIFVELLSIIISYNDKSINILFQIPKFQGYYGKIMNFENILQKGFINHISMQIKRRAVWLLSNITGSQQFYRYGLHFIINFFDKNILQQDYTSQNLSQQELLIKQTIIQTIMNYLSNLRNFNQIQELLQIKRQNDDNKTEPNIYQVKNYNEQTLFNWIMKILGSVIGSLSENIVIVNEGQKFIQVLIYCLYNILSLQNNTKSIQEQNKQNIILSIMQTLSIPKHLEIIYQNVQTQNNQSNYFTMLQTLLDQIEKSKNTY